MSSRRSLLVQLLFAFLLAFAQQQATLHALEHDFEHIHAGAAKAVAPGEAFCDECLATAHLGHVDGVAVGHLALPPHVPPRIARVGFTSASPAFVGAYDSRAPPVSPG